MRGGDLSNEAPPRYLVHLDVITATTVATEKVFGIFPVHRKETVFDRRALAHMWLFWQRSEATLELFDVGCSDEDMEEVVATLDKMGGSPFRYATAFRSIQEVVDLLPYRNEVRGVIDLPERAFRYGSYYVDLARI